jgi:3-oxoacyl-[acyl-carrier protein] reductase/2-[hydroxy(phenyl)methyl]-succinyl-CoA dehydrogenase BbsC subunit
MSGQASKASNSAAASDYSGQVTLVSNVCDDIGAGIARYFASKGAMVGLSGANEEALELLAGEIVGQGGQAIAVANGQAGSEGISEIVGRVGSKFGKIDILVNNPGEVANCSLAELSVGDFKTNIDTMLTTSFAFMREVVPGMRARQYGRIINICSLSYLGLATQANLAASHAGIFGLTRSIALETATDGITVNSLIKGDIATADLSAADAEMLANRTPVKRLGTTADIVHALNFFASASTTYVTGQTLFVCGGKSAYFSMSV